MDGIALAKKMEERGFGNTSAIILMSAAVGHDELLRESIRVRKDAIVAKPITPSSLFDALMTAQGVHRGRVKTNIFNPSEMTRPIRGRRILLVEDNEINQQVATEFLQLMGLRVTIAGDGHQAIIALQREPFDLVLMDLQMPEMDGFEATRIIRGEEAWHKLPIIAMTAAAMSQDRERCLAAGMNEHISKPIDPQQLTNMLLAWLPHHEFPDEVEIPKNIIKSSAPLLLPDSLPGFDLNRGLALLGGKQQLWRNLAQRFGEDFAKVKEELATHLAKGEMEEARKLVHRLRGVVGNLGAMELYQAASELERRLKNAENPEPAWERVQQNLTEVLNTIATLMTSNTGTTPSIPSEVDRDCALPLLNNVMSLLEKREFVPSSFSEEMRNCFAGTEYTQGVERLLRHLDNFDFDGAQSELVQLKQRLNKPESPFPEAA
ncbi:two-component system, cell cycle response regulator DivK [Gammaproteobacteria bacterium]